MTRYQNNLENVENLDLRGFFVGWPNPPEKEEFLKLLKGSYKVVLAIEGEKLIGFITSNSDGVLSAYIPFLEVLPDFQSQGVGTKLVLSLREELRDLYMVDLLCDQNLIPYYEKLGMRKATGMVIRNYENQDGKCK